MFARSHPTVAPVFLWLAVPWLCAATLAGGLVGSSFAVTLPDFVLKSAFAAFLLVAGGSQTFKTLRWV